MNGQTYQVFEVLSILGFLHGGEGAFKEVVARIG